MKVDSRDRKLPKCMSVPPELVPTEKRQIPSALTALPAFLAMTYLYKRSNWLWSYMIRQQLVNAVWSPLVRAARAANLRHRRRLLEGSCSSSAGMPVSAAV